MEVLPYLQIAISSIALLGGFFAWILGLRIQGEILKNNEKLEKDLQVTKDFVSSSVTNLRNEMTRELGAHITKLQDRQDVFDHLLNDLISSLKEKILTTCNGTYRRSEVCDSMMCGVGERIDGLKELIQLNLSKIESSLENQIAAVKEKINE